MAPYGGPMKSLLLAMTLAPQAMNRRFLLFLLLLTLAHAAPVKRDYNLDEKYYTHGGIRCLSCPPGTFVKKPCTVPDTLGTCELCDPGHTYSEYLTGMDTCLPCDVCRPDQEEVSSCTVTKNAICKCKKGTFCTGDSCEICKKCSTSCPPNEDIQAPCNSTSDIQCGPPEPATGADLAAILVPLLLFAVLILGVFCIWFFYCRKRCDRSRWIPKILTVSFKCDENPAGESEAPFLTQTPKLCFKENITENGENEAIHKAFNIFVDYVPVSQFEKFVRELGLTSNEIEHAKRDNEDTYSRCYAMLTLLHQDKQFDVNIWLKKLRDIKMKKVAQDISRKLTTDGLFEWTSQG